MVLNKPHTGLAKCPKKKLVCYLYLNYYYRKYDNTIKKIEKFVNWNCYCYDTDFLYSNLFI